MNQEDFETQSTPDRAEEVRNYATEKFRHKQHLNSFVNRE